MKCRLRGALAALVVMAIVASCDGDGRDPGDRADPVASVAAVSDTDQPDAEQPATAVVSEEVQLDVCWTSEPAEGGGEIAFENVTGEYGLVEPLTGMYGHAVATSDVNRDGWIDLFVGSFADRPTENYQVRGASGPRPDTLLLGGPDGFLVDDTFPGEMARSSGATFADLDNDDDVDLIVARNPREGSEVSQRITTVYEHVEDEWIAATSFAADVGARSVAALDVDRDGLLDVALAGDRFGAGPTRFYRNQGDLEFADTTAKWGIPLDMATLALATVDLDGDGWLDVTMSGDGRVLMGGPNGFTVTEQAVLTWETFGNEDDPAGIAVGDLDNDGRPDLVVGHHYNSTIDSGERVPVRIFLNRSDPGRLELEDVTEDAESPPLPTKSPHVAIADLDNDGWQDIVTSAVGTDGSPIFLRQEASADESLRFDVVGEPAEGQYFVTGITTDVDRDGRLDQFMIAWEPESPSGLFRAVGPSGSWFELNTDWLSGEGDGTTVSVRFGGEPALTAWVHSTTGYAAGSSTVVHFGLGDLKADVVDLSITSPYGRQFTMQAVANSHNTAGRC